MPMPGAPSEYVNIKMMLMKRFSEFKAFRQQLVTVLGPHSESVPPLPTRQVLSMG